MIPTRTRPLGGGDLPAGYTRLEYLEGTDSQYIVTAYDVTPDTGVRIEYEQLPEAGTLEEPVGTRGKNSAGKDVNWFPPRKSSTPGTQHSYYYNAVYAFKFQKWERVTAEMNFQGSGRLKVQNTHGEMADIELSPAQDVTLPALKIFGSAFRMVGRIWRCEISQGQYIVQSFIPALAPNGRPCMFDLVTRRAFYNAATTGPDFLYA